MSEYRDERTVAAELDAGQSVEAVLGIGGTVTSSNCLAGGEIRSGIVVASLSGRPVLALHSAVPFYRDIGPGTAGADVDALRVELRRQGYDVSAAGAYEANLRAAVLKIQTDLAMAIRDGVLHKDETLWLPTESVRVKSCNASLGHQYLPESPFLTVGGAVNSLRLVFPSGQPPAVGARIASFGSVTAPVTEDGLVKDPALLAEVSRSHDFAESQASTSPKPLSIKTALSSPLKVAKLPVSAVFGAQNDRACVKATDGTTHHIVIVGSSAGSVLATFQQDVPREILLGSSIGGRECSETSP
ncbi:hypothetical protein [Paenarthrobacter sp. NCHU4564]|uniref:hypothetical protein n=1 Tax=Paenarthrobacter sp. NCHU4564 TaxID=3451353 RepID=UPI003F95CE71